MDLTNERWNIIEPLLPTPPQRSDRRGRPWRNPRDVLDGILWVLGTGAPWKDLPERYPPYQTCHRRFQRWARDGTFQHILEALAEDLAERGGIDVSEAFIDGSFTGAQKRGRCVGKTKRGKGSKIMAITDAHGLPIAVDIESASPHEVTLVERTLDASFVSETPEHLIGHCAYDSDKLDERLEVERGIELIAPNRPNRNNMTQDGRPLRRYKRRWKVERLFAWLHNFRRIVIGYEYHPENFRAFVQLGCAIILLRHL